MLLERQIESTDRQIDQLIYVFYDLTVSDIKVIEDATA